MPTPVEITPGEFDYRAVPFTGASIGNQTIATLSDSTKRFKLMALYMNAQGGANTVTIQSGAGGTSVVPVADLAADLPFVLPWNPHGWGWCAVGAILNMVLTAATVVNGIACVQEVN
jgi:hypothetical protein